MAQAYGWGVNDADSIAFPDILQEVSVLIIIIRIIVNNNKVSLPVVTPAQCATDVTNVEDGMICAGGVEGESSCIVSAVTALKLYLEASRQAALALKLI